MKRINDLVLDAVRRRLRPSVELVPCLFGELVQNLVHRLIGHVQRDQLGRQGHGPLQRRDYFIQAPPDLGIRVGSGLLQRR